LINGKGKEISVIYLKLRVSGFLRIAKSGG